jgi:hypothetical protein
VIFALISETKLVSSSELYRMSAALRENCRHFAKAYEYDYVPSIVVVDKESNLPDGCFPIAFVGGGGSQGVLGEHWFDGSRGIPAGRVFVQNTTALNGGPHSVCETTSHEILEAWANEMLAIWKPHPRRQGVEIAFEVCDPTQDQYSIRVGNTDWQCSNFVTAFYWMSELPMPLNELERDFGYGVDWCKRMAAPGEILSEGYAVMRETKNPKRRWSEGYMGPIGQNSSQLSRKQHYSSRTQRLLAGV